jgi:hypothetical protein
LNVIEPCSERKNFYDYKLAKEWKLENAIYVANAEMLIVEI